jgi:hypothetical protein
MIKDNEDFIVIQNSMPHIAKSVELFWGTVDFNRFLDKIMSDTRDGHRVGFPKDVASALLRLSIKHDSSFPDAMIKVSDIWSLNLRPY